MAAERPIVGYFNWRTDMRGRLVPEKILKEHRDAAVSSANHQQVEHYQYNLVTEIPLDEAHWAMTLDELLERYPAPGHALRGAADV